MNASQCCPGAGSMAHVRGCVNHPEAPGGLVAASERCSASTTSGERCPFRAHFDHAVHVGVRVCGHHQFAHFIFTVGPPVPVQRPASNSEGRKRSTPPDPTDPAAFLWPPAVSTAIWAEVIREACAKAWDEGNRSVLTEPNPYRMAGDHR